VVAALGSAWRRKLGWYPGDWIWPALLALLVAVVAGVVSAVWVADSSSSAAETVVATTAATSLQDTTTVPEPTPTATTGTTPATSPKPPPPPPAQTPVSWVNILKVSRLRPIVVISFAQFCGNTVLTFFLIDFVNYLATERHMAWITVGIFVSFPFMASAVGGLVGGGVADWIIRRGGSITIARKLPVTPATLFPIGSSTKTFTVAARIDTPEELVAFSQGGILPYVLRQLVKKSQ